MYQLNYLTHLNAVNVNVHNVNFNFYYSEKKIKENNIPISKFVDVFLYYLNFVDISLFEGYIFNIFDRSHPDYVKTLQDLPLCLHINSKLKLVYIDIDYLFNLSVSLDVDKILYDYLATIVGTVYYRKLIQNKKSYMFKKWSSIRNFSNVDKELLFTEDFSNLYSKGYANYSNLVQRVDLDFLKKFTHARYIQGFHDFIMLWYHWNNTYSLFKYKPILDKNLGLVSYKYTKEDPNFKYCSIHFKLFNLSQLNNFNVRLDSYKFDLKGLYIYDYNSSEYNLVN